VAAAVAQIKPDGPLELERAQPLLLQVFKMCGKVSRHFWLRHHVTRQAPVTATQAKHAFSKLESISSHFPRENSHLMVEIRFSVFSVLIDNKTKQQTQMMFLTSISFPGTFKSLWDLTGKSAILVKSALL